MKDRKKRFIASFLAFVIALVSLTASPIGLIAQGQSDVYSYSEFPANGRPPLPLSDMQNSVSRPPEPDRSRSFGDGIAIEALATGIYHAHPTFEPFLDETNRIRGWDSFDDTVSTNPIYSLTIEVLDPTTGRVYVWTENLNFSDSTHNTGSVSTTVNSHQYVNLWASAGFSEWVVLEGCITIYYVRDWQSGSVTGAFMMPNENVRIQALFERPEITTFLLPFAGLNEWYEVQLQTVNFPATGVTWFVNSYELPPGLSFDVNTKTISGIPTTLGTFSFWVRAGHWDFAESEWAFGIDRQFSITVSQRFAVNVEIENPAPLRNAWIATDGRAFYTPPVYALQDDWVQVAVPAENFLRWEVTDGNVFFSSDWNDGQGFEHARFQMLGENVTIRAVFEPITTPSILTTSLPDGTVGVSYNYQIQAINIPTGGFLHIWNSLPNDLTFNEATGIISGTPTAPGIHDLVVFLFDAGDNILDSALLSLEINSVDGTFTVAVASNLPPGIGASYSGAGQYLPGTSVTIRRGASETETFNGWIVQNDISNTVASQLVGAGAEATFTMPANNVVIGASWILIEGILRWLEVTPGTLVPDFSPNTFTYNIALDYADDSIELIAWPNHWSETVTFAGAFDPEVTNLTVNPTNVFVDHRGGFSATFALGVGLTRISITVIADGGSQNTYTINVTRTERPTYAVTIGGTAAAQTALSPLSPVTAGQTVTVTTTAPGGRRFTAAAGETIAVTATGVAGFNLTVSADRLTATGSFTMPAGAVGLTVNAAFETIPGPTFPVSVQDGVTGVAIQGGPQFAQGASVTLNITPPGGQRLATNGITVTGAIITNTAGATSVTFTMPANDVTITGVVFEPLPAATNHIVTFNLNGGTRIGGGALTQTVPHGGVATAPSVSRSNHNFSGWSSNVTGMTMDNITGNVTFTAQWTWIGSGNDGGGSGGGWTPTPTPTPAPTPTPTPTPAPTPTPEPEPLPPYQNHEAVQRQLDERNEYEISDVVVLAASGGASDIVLCRDTLKLLAEAQAPLRLMHDMVWVELSANNIEELLESVDDTDYNLVVSIRILSDKDAESTNIYLVSAAVSLAVGEATLLSLSDNFTLYADLSGINLQGANNHKVVALHNGQVNGSLNPVTSLFAVDTTTTGEFTIAYVANLIRLDMTLGSPIIRDLASNAPAQVMDVLPIIVNDRALIPLRFVGEALGAEVDWISPTEYTPSTAIIVMNGRELRIPLNGVISPELAALGMDAPAQVMYDRTMVPLRFVSEFFGALVTWDGETRGIEILLANLE